MGIDSYRFALEKAKNDLLDILAKSADNPNTAPLHEETHYQITAFLHCATDCWERVYRSGVEVTPNDAEYVAAFRRANNLLKHNPRFILFHVRVSSATYPMSLPMNFGDAYTMWADIPLQSGENKDLILPYDVYLSEKPVDETIQALVTIIMHYLEAIEPLL